MQPADYKDLIWQLGGVGPFSKHLGISYHQAYQMEARNVITNIYWEELIELAREEGIEGINPEWFFRQASKRRGKWRRTRAA